LLGLWGIKADTAGANIFVLGFRDAEDRQASCMRKAVYRALAISARETRTPGTEVGFIINKLLLFCGLQGLRKS